MAIWYELGFQDQWVPIMSTELKHLSEESFILDFEAELNRKKSLKIEDIVRSLYGVQSGKHDSVSSAALLLKFLLSDRFAIRSNGLLLQKSYYPIQFIAAGPSVVLLGEYYKTGDSVDILTQYFEFCTWQDQLSGVPGLYQHITYQLLDDGFKVFVQDQKGIQTLLKA